MSQKELIALKTIETDGHAKNVKEDKNGKLKRELYRKGFIKLDHNSNYVITEKGKKILDMETRMNKHFREK